MSFFRIRRLTVALVLLCGAIGLSPGVAKSRVAASGGAEKTASAFALYDSIGVNTHFSEGIERANYPGIAKLLGDLGIKHVREGFNPNPDRRAMELSKSLHERYGIDFTETASPGQSPDLWALYKKGIGAGMVGLEGANESDNRQKDLNWLPPTLQLQKDLWRAVHGGTPELAGLTVTGPSLLTCTGAGSFGDQSPYMDYTNMHRYYGGRPPSVLGWGPSTCHSTRGYGSMEMVLGVVHQMAASRPVHATETGYCTAPLKGCNPENVAVAYTPQIFTYNFIYEKNYGTSFPRTYLYQLLSEDLASPSHSYGLVNPDYSPKPMYYALQGFIARVKDVPSTARPLAYAVTGPALQHVQWLPLSYANGDFGMILYSEAPIWDPNGTATPQGSPLSVANVDVALSAPNMHDVVVSTLDPKGIWRDAKVGSTAHLSVGPYMQIVRWSPGATALQRRKAPRRIAGAR